MAMVLDPQLALLEAAMAQNLNAKPCETDPFSRQHTGAPDPLAAPLQDIDEEEDTWAHNESTLSELQLGSKVFAGLERSLDDGSLEQSLHEIVGEEAEAERMAVKSEFRGPLFLGLEQALDGGALKEVLVEDGQKSFLPPAPPSLPNQLGGKLFAGLERTLEDGSLEQVLYELAEEEAVAGRLAVKSEFQAPLFRGLEHALDGGALEGALCEVAEENQMADRRALKSDVRGALFCGLEEALISGELQKVLGEIEADAN